MMRPGLGKRFTLRRTRNEQSSKNRRNDDGSFPIKEIPESPRMESNSITRKSTNPSVGIPKSKNKPHRRCINGTNNKTDTPKPPRSPASSGLLFSYIRTDVDDENDALSSSSPPRMHRNVSSPQAKEARHIARAAAALDDMGNALFEQGNYERAMATYQRALKLKRQTIHVRLEDQEQIMRRSSCSTLSAATAGSGSGRLDHPNKHTQQQGDQDENDNDEIDDHSSVVDEHTSHLLASVATSINNIGYLRQRSGATAEETMRAYQDSLRIKRDVLGADHLSVGKTLNNIGSVHFSTRQWEEALGAYREALRIMRHHLGDRHLDVATVHSNMGDVYMAQKKAEEAHECYQRALHIRWEHLGDHDPKVIRLLQKIAALEMRVNKNGTCDGADGQDGEDQVDPEEEEEVRALHHLHSAVQADLTYMDQVERKLALDMVRDKLRIMRGMRDVDAAEELDEEMMLRNARTEAPRTPPPRLSPAQRSDALSSVKERLAKLKASRENDKETPLVILSPSSSCESPTLNRGGHVDVPELGKCPSRNEI